MRASRLYSEMITPRDVPVDGLTPWHWVTTDHGAFDGPKSDWEHSHKERYLRHVTKFDVCVQAGGNCGMYPALFAQLFKNVYTFEPDPLNFFALVQNCQYENVVKMQAALGEHRELVSVHRLTMDNVGMHRVQAGNGGFVPQLRIDDLGLTACDLIQLDIEGYEIHALRGAVSTIAKYKPVIVCENGNATIAECLRHFGYAPVDTSMMDTIYKVTT